MTATTGGARPGVGACADADAASPRVAALLWDVDGTLAETERDGHLVAFNQAFAAEGLPWRWDDRHYGKLLEVTGGRERLLHDMAIRPEAPTSPAEREQLTARVHAAKNAFYADLVAGGQIPLRPGVRELFDDCRARGVPMAVTTTTTRASVEALLRCHLGEDWSSWFRTLVCADDVRRKKPDPEVFRLALARLGTDPGHTVAIEDSPNGVVAARAAGCRVLVTRSIYFESAPITGALAVGPGLDRRDGWQPPAPPTEGLGRIGLDDIRGWLAREVVAA